MPTSTAAIIGAGPSGIAALKELARHGIDAVCFEKGPQLAPTWAPSEEAYASPVYDTLKLNNSSGRMRFAEKALSRRAHEYLPYNAFHDYLRDVVASLQLSGKIHVNTEITSVIQRDGLWVLSNDGNEIYRSSHLIMATGLNARPYLPMSAAGFAGPVVHSHDYRDPESFATHRVLVIGAGNSGAEIAAETSATAAAVHLALPHPVHFVPRQIGRFACDRLDSPLLSYLPLPARQAVHDVALAKFRRRVRAAGMAVPPDTLLRSAWTISSVVIDHIASGAITVRAWPVHFCGNTVTYSDGTTDEYDDLVLATGYLPQFPELPDNPPLSRTTNGCYLKIVPPSSALPATYFVGYVLPLGPLLPVVEAQAAWVSRVITGRVSLPNFTNLTESVEKQQVLDRRRFTASASYSMLVDPYPYIRTLRKDA